MSEYNPRAFAKIRKLFPHTCSEKKVVYLNSASFGPFSTPVKKALEENIDLRVMVTRDDSHDTFNVSEKLRSDYASLIGAKKKEVGLGLNTSFGLNIAAFGLPLKRGDEILVSDREFPAIVYTFKQAAKERGLTLKFVESSNSCFDIEKFEKAITSRTRLLAISWVQFFNGYRNDLKTLSEICKRHNMFFVVDGIQGMGTEPINVHRLGIDIFTSGCQKWMLSPQGCGFFYLADHIRDHLSHSWMSWLGCDWKMQFSDLFRYDNPLHDSARRFEMGYYVILNLLGMNASVEIFKELGIRNIKKHNTMLINELIGYLKQNSYYSITSSLTAKHRSSILTFTCNDIEELHRSLLKHGVVLVQREGSIRVSAHLFNNRSDILYLIDKLKLFASKK